MLFPDIEPYETGFLDVGDGHRIYWETSGNPRGRPAVVFHGGPGSGAGAGWRRYFDPEAYRIVLFDQRGCGRSTPSAAETLAANTLPHLIADVEALRRHLGVEHWLIFGGSWGTTLGLAYAERHPDRVSAMVLFSVTSTTAAEVEWITRHMGRIFPREWARFREAVPEDDRDGDLAAAYARLLDDPDPAVRERAALEWCRWEDTHVSVAPGYAPDPRYEDPAFRMVFARLVTHYWSHAAWLEDGALLRDVRRLAGIPGTLVHGRLDISSPLDIPWRLSQAWPGSKLVVIDDAGHGTAHAAMTEALLTALAAY
ncbi:prolyl aminopeptidase [Streptosporangiaceae bacterium NEAU-GS5]|nr:prolyl aminopeptidase [Streptosporangiaceae bacterium NEAU-GS5]